MNNVLKKWFMPQNMDLCAIALEEANNWQRGSWKLIVNQPHHVEYRLFHRTVIGTANLEQEYKVFEAVEYRKSDTFGLTTIIDRKYLPINNSDSYCIFLVEW